MQINRETMVSDCFVGDYGREKIKMSSSLRRHEGEIDLYPRDKFRMPEMS